MSKGRLKHTDSDIPGFPAVVSKLVGDCNTIVTTYCNTKHVRPREWVRHRHRVAQNAMPLEVSFVPC